MSDTDFLNVHEAFFQTADHEYDKLAIHIEIDVDEHEMLQDGLFARDLLQQVFLTSTAKKRRVEVREKRLTAAEREMFRQAKSKEWASFIDNNVVELACSKGIDPARVIGSRWVLTWKTVDERDTTADAKTGKKATKIAKARLVILGYQDPDLGQYARSSPTLTRTAKHLILAICAQNEWDLFSLDAKTAFLTGELSDRAKSLYMKVPADLHQMLKLPQGSVFKLLKSVYGLAEAPIAWYRYLKAALERIGWWAHPLDECMMMLYDPSGKLQGIIGIHVDDLLICGKGHVFDKAMKTLESRLNFGTRKYHDFTYCGLQMQQDKKTKQIRLHQNTYIEGLQPMSVKGLADGKPIPQGEPFTAYRGLLGGLSWSAINTRPDIAFDVS
jgi:hypothetical protein